MNNLLRTLTESQARSNISNTDLKLLLTTVKEGRRQGHGDKLADPFYDSLEGLLLDLRTVSIDNHDAEAFLKPVLKAEAPDYYDVIQTPMDFQSMLKKVKQKAYKSKKEFKDDLDLIWSNCFQYNAAPSHPLRKCAERLRVKADRLLQNITDRKERTDPVIPFELSGSAHPKVNGHINGIGRAHTYSPSTSAPSATKPSTPASKSSSMSLKASSLARAPRKDLPFAETPALIRTPEGMAAFRELDRNLEASFQAGSSSKEAVVERLCDLASTGYEFSIPALTKSTSDGKAKSDSEDNASLGDKRKLNGISDNARPHKRPRVNSYSSSQTISPQQSQALPPPTYGQSPYISTPSSVGSVTLVGSSVAGLSSTPTSPDATPHASSSTSVSTLIEHDPTPLWWSASHSDFLLPNGLPEIPFRSSSPPPHLRKRRRQPSPPPIPLFPGILSQEASSSSSVSASQIPAPKRKKKRKKDVAAIEGTGGDQPAGEPSNPKSLLSLMNNNIRTIKRIRMTHAKFSALGLGRDGNAAGAGGEDGADGTAVDMGAMMDVDDAGVIAGGVGVDESDKLDDRPWMVRLKETAVVEDEEVTGEKGKNKEKEQEKEKKVTIKIEPEVTGIMNGVPEVKVEADSAMPEMMLVSELGKRRKPKRPVYVAGGVDMGQKNAEGCLKWMGEKVLEHVGFQGSSSVALDVLTSVTSEYLQNVGRTIKFLSDKFGNKMTAEEIILHTLFESGMSKVSDLERYVSDDVERYGSRLGDLEKKLVGAYREVTAVDTVVDEDGIFAEDSEDEDNALALGGFADSLGMDYFGLKELGIADEFGMSSLSIPRRLLKGKKKQNLSSHTAKPSEPPLPYPLPPPLVPLVAKEVPRQIGLLQPYYNTRLGALMPPPPMQPQPPIAPYARPSIPVLQGPALAQGYAHMFMPPPPPPPTMPPPTQPQGSSTPQASPIPPPTVPQAVTGTPSPVPPATALTAPQSTPQPQLPYPQPYPYPVPYVAVTMHPAQAPQPALPPPTLALPDDPPAPAQAKMGPLGQILKTGGAANTTTKKKTAKAAAAAAAGGAKVDPKTEPNDGPSTGVDPGSTAATPLMNGTSSGPPSAVTDETTPASTEPKKKKGVTGVGKGNGRKKKLLEAAAAQAQAQAQAQQQQQQRQGQQQQYPPVVTASA
ncbi:Transcriptional activator spt7 [Paramarasmius palmivorus]|uniref:Transcriptional activator spt7 n=1 Tax=Paramarasmius palmivorus TaxID=297713 RepID=A0AAW0BVN9_9AGAR